MTLLDTLNEKTCTLKDYASYEAYTGRVHLTHNPDTSTPVTSSYFAQGSAPHRPSLDDVSLGTCLNAP